MVIWVEIASRNYKLDRYRCFIGILVTRPDGGVNEPAADGVSCCLSVGKLVKRQDLIKFSVAVASVNKNKNETCRNRFPATGGSESPDGRFLDARAQKFSDSPSLT